jgi:tetratricopeptide (TPR) repeat protein
MDAPRTYVKARWLVGIAALVVSLLMVWEAARHSIASYWADFSQPDYWLRAAEAEPDNAEHWYRLGRYNQIDFENSNLSLAVAYYKRATEISPNSARYWLDLAEAQETALQLKDAEQAFRRAQHVYPASADVAWRYGNFLLRQNRQDEAFAQIHTALTVQPSLAALAFSRCWQSTQDVERILKFALPVSAEIYWSAIDFLADARELTAAMVVWDRLLAVSPSFSVQRAFRLQDVLMEARRVEDADRVWEDSLRVTGIQREPQTAGSLLWNGGFEQPLLNGGMGWRFNPVPGASMSFDGRMARSESRSLRVAFSGSSNISFQQPWQYVPVRPNTSYRLEAYFRTEGVTTTNGVQLEARELDSNGVLHATRSVTGTLPWTPSEVEFTTGAETRVLIVVICRRPSQKLDNKIRGTVWVDDVSLVPVTERAALQ